MIDSFYYNRIFRIMNFPNVALANVVFLKSTSISFSHLIEQKTVRMFASNRNFKNSTKNELDIQTIY